MAKKRGRPVGKPDTRRQIAEAARRRFLADGYVRTSVRAIARDVGVDPGAVKYHFGTKERLFGTVMSMTFTPPQLVEEIFGANPTPDAPRRLLAAALETWETTPAGAGMARLLLEMDQEPVRHAFAQYMQEETIGRLAAVLGGGVEAQKRAVAVGAVMAGTILVRYVVKVEPLASMSRDDVVRYLAPSLEAAFQPRGRSRGVGGAGGGSAAIGGLPTKAASLR